jgi:hypothetical protein
MDLLNILTARYSDFLIPRFCQEQARRRYLLATVCDFYRSLYGTSLSLHVNLSFFAIMSSLLLFEFFAFND